MQSDATKSRRRAMVTAGTAASLVVSLVGGTLALMFSGGPQQSTIAVKPIQPPVSAPAIEPEPAPSAGGQTDLSIFGLGGSSLSSMADSGSSVSSVAGASSGVAPLGLTPSASTALPALPTLPTLPTLPSAQLPNAAAFPAGPAFDWNALLAPLVAAQANAQAANVAGYIVGGITNSVAVLLGDLILFAAYANNGQPLLAALENTLASPGAAAAAGTALMATMPPVPALPDFSGLSAAFAAAAGAPPLGVPAPPALPPLPTPEQLAASLAGLSALGALPALPPFTLPGMPQLPRAEDVVGGVVGGAVAIVVGGFILGALFRPPSITRMLGMPF